MPWNIEAKDHCVIVSMNSNKVNALNPEFFNDFHEAFDTIEKNYPKLPVVLISDNKKVFSAGIDFPYSFDLFKTKDPAKVWAWFEEFNKVCLRLFNQERMTIAAINGHIYAGGLILALCCDFRVGLQGNSRYSLNEVPIGIPMPSTYTEIIRHRLGNHFANETILLGGVYSPKEALDKNFIQYLTYSMDDLRTTCRKIAKTIHPNAREAYIQSKKVLNHFVRETIENHSLKIDQEQTCHVICCEDSLKMHELTYEKLQAKSKA